MRTALAGSLAFSVVAGALAGAAPAEAQQQTQPAAATDAERQIEEIVVTAQFREERVQDVPISINAFTGEDLRTLRAQRPRDLARLTPGLFMNTSSISEADPEFTVRGIGTNDSESNQNPATALYVDGVPVPFNAMVGHTLFDVERVEVLKGPQGTLYGRNTTAGAINFISKKPESEWGGFFDASFGRFNRTDLEGAFNIPLHETFAARFAGAVHLQKGWQKIAPFEAARPVPDRRSRGETRRNGDVERKAFRLSTRWTPSDAFEMVTSFDAGFDDSEHMGFLHAGNLRKDNPSEFCIFATEGIRDETQCASFARDSSTATLIPVELNGRQFLVQDPNDPGEIVAVSDPNTGPRTILSNFSFGSGIDAEAFGITNTMTWQAGRVTVTSVTGYRSFERTFGSDRAGPFLDGDIIRDNDLEVFSQEIRIASGTGWDDVSWVVGGFFTHEDVFDSNPTDMSELVPFSAIFQSTFNQETDAVAGFGQIEWDLTDEWRLIGGLRFTAEDRSFDFHGEMVGFGPQPVDFFEDKVDSNELTWRGGINYRPGGGDMLFYASASKGFRGKGFPATIAFSEPQLFPFEEETLIAYEGGFKTTLFDGDVQFNGAVYYYDWKDFQAQTAVDREGIRLIVLANAGDARVVGGETEVKWFATSELSIRFGANFMDAEIVSGEFDGDNLAQAPDVMLSGAVEYEADYTIAGLRPFAQLDYTFNDKMDFILPNHPGATEESYLLLNGRLGVIAADSGWKVSVWGENITDKVYRTNVFGPGSGFLPGRIRIGPPAMFGGTVSYNF